MEQLVWVNLGHLERKSAKYVARPIQAKMEQLVWVNLGHLGQKVLTGPKRTDFG
ncbi:hypothetical protein KI387_008581, partial [Taxus chinensis]